jgi:hypothetical protein
MPTPAKSADLKTETTDASQPKGSWYSAFTSVAEPVQQQTGPAAPLAGDHTTPDLLDTLTPADIPGPHTRGAEAPWQALFSLQHTKLDRLALEHERLMERIDTLLQNQERELVLRQHLQNQVEHIKLSPPNVDLDTVRREARAGVTEELKPVLLAILDALERFVRKPVAEPIPAVTDLTVTEDMAATDTTASADPYLFEDYGRLPAILTRPLHELVEDAGDPGRSNSGTKKQRPRKTHFHNRKRPRTAAPDTERNGGPGPFTWTTVISS